MTVEDSFILHAALTEILVKLMQSGTEPFKVFHLKIHISPLAVYTVSVSDVFNLCNSLRSIRDTNICETPNFLAVSICESPLK